MQKNIVYNRLFRRIKLFCRRNYALPIAALLMYGLYFYMLKVEPDQLRITHWTFSSPAIPVELDNFRIVFAADIHLNDRQMRNLSDIIKALNAQRADLILLGGDYVNANRRDAGIDKLMPFLNKLSAPCGVFAIPGNHEYRRGIREVKQAFANSTVQFLQDCNVKIRSSQGGYLNLIGLDYHNNPHKRQDPERFNQLIIPGMFNLVLAHTPEEFDFLPSGTDLTLAAHTHGGQIAIPFLGSVINPPRYGRQYTYGRVNKNNRTMFITAGLGSAYTQARFFMKPEIVVITLKSKR